MRKNLYKILVLILGLLAINMASTKWPLQFDLTKDKRYSLSEITLQIVNKVDKPIVINVFLEGDFPSEFNRLQSEIKQHLEQLQGLNNQIEYHFINPLGKEKELIQKGLKPSQLAVQENGVATKRVIFPWAVVHYNDKSEHIPFLSNNSKQSELIVQNAIENIEYLFTDAIYKLTKKERKKIAILSGNGELDFSHIDGLLKALAPYYHFEPFPLDSADVVPQKTLQLLQKFDLTIIAKPTQRFTENEKFVLDQYQMNNGKSLWLIDNVIAENDSLVNTGNTLALKRTLNITDLLFHYGLRVKHNLVKDLYSASIRLATGNIGGKTQYKNVPWHYYPLVKPNETHVISKNTPAVKLQYVSSIDTLKNDIKKTVLLQSSEMSRPYGAPLEISFDEISRKPRKQDYNKGHQMLGVLLEGQFKSAYTGRVQPFKIKTFKAKSTSNKLIVIADGDIIKNEFYQGKPLDLGLDRWTGIQNGNKLFLLNAIQYLLDDDTHLLSLRSKSLHLQFLDKEKVYQEKTFWQVISMAIPLGLIAILGGVFMVVRRRKYR